MWKFWWVCEDLGDIITWLTLWLIGTWFDWIPCKLLFGYTTWLSAGLPNLTVWFCYGLD